MNSNLHKAGIILLVLVIALIITLSLIYKKLDRESKTYTMAVISSVGFYMMAGFFAYTYFINDDIRNEAFEKIKGQFQ
jgi:uncharacterized membrane protein